ncbi:MAG: hypothetical protein R2942_14755 [Ignavibacteria bacterium]
MFHQEGEEFRNGCFGKLQKITCQMPLSEMNDYSTKLRSMTQGRGYYDRKFSHYGMSKEVEMKIIEEYEERESRSCLNSE